MSNSPLIKVSLTDKEKSIGVVNYSDMVVLDDSNDVIAIRIGGYPEAVQAMLDAMRAGCCIELTGSKQTIKAQTKGSKNYDKKLSKDGIYAEGFYCLKDDTPQSFSLDDDESSEIVKDINLYIFCTSDDELFSQLDKKLSVPLLPEFRDYFLSELKSRRILKPLKVYAVGNSFYGWHLKISQDEKQVVKVLEDGLKNNIISIPSSGSVNEDMFKDINSFTSYLKQFGVYIAKKIQSCFPPRYVPEEQPVCKTLHEINDHVIKNAGYSLFDAQLQRAEAIKRQLEISNMAILVAECGTGKTKIGSAAVYAYQHSNKKLKAYNKAFNVVICPSHLKKKWVRELNETVPDCYAVCLNTLSDVDKLYDFYMKSNKTVFAVLSKENAKNGYMRRPGVCWSTARKGFLCPRCGAVQEMSFFDGDTTFNVPANAEFFRKETNANHKCQSCGEPLWCVFNPDDTDPKRQEWVRIGGYGYVHRRFAESALNSSGSKGYEEAIQKVADNPGGVFVTQGAYARYPLASYIKRKVRKIDALIVDELHQYSGESAQGQAMAELAGIADKTVAMTATLVNGYAKGMFYLLYRLKSRLMIKDNQDYDNPTDFCRQYGVTERIYEVTMSEYNATGKVAKRKTREKYLPGISPLVYSRFLMDNAVFLTLEDMGKELPDYEEIPLSCQMSDEVKKQYEFLEDDFKSIMISDIKLGNRIMSSYMNLLSVYPDQPYGHEPILNPLLKNKEEILISPVNIGDEAVVQPKDTEVLKLIERKVSNGERVIVYTAWTRLDTRARLKKLLEERQIPAVILSSSVPTTKREEWVDKQLENGVKVLIVNPALVETGLDLNAFTTLIFYNIAYNLYIFRQAARRSYRINQKAPRIEVYMFYYADTMQQRALRLMASKLAAATVIEGNISEEGLAAMSDCQDLTTQLAKELMNGLKENEQDIIGTFKSMAICNNRKAETEAEPDTPVILKPEPKSETVVIPLNIKTVKTGRKPRDTGQMSLFDLLAS